MTSFERLVDLMARLRAPGGCPWDREQTHGSLKRYLLEEAYEVLDAIDDGDDGNLAEELGDLLLQIVFHAQVAAEEGRFSVDDVARVIGDKLVRRHPHVFGDVKADTPEQVLRNWEAIKRGEKEAAGRETESVLDGVPRSLPALRRAQRVQEKAAGVGFDWSDREEVEKKVREEVEEFIEAAASGKGDRIEDELGDILFSIVNLARFVGHDAEDALSRTNAKFIRRFRYIECELARKGRDPASATLAEMDALWEAAKDAD